MCLNINNMTFVLSDTERINIISLHRTCKEKNRQTN
jgi:hypothetical protein